MVSSSFVKEPYMISSSFGKEALHGFLIKQFRHICFPLSFVKEPYMASSLFSKGALHGFLTKHFSCICFPLLFKRSLTWFPLAYFLLFGAIS